MTEIRAVPLGDGRTRVSHPSGAVVETDSSP